MSRAGTLARMPTSNTTLTAGTIAYFAMTSAPGGWLKCNGAAISRTTYAALFAAIGTAFGVGDGSTTFNLPELRGEFLRCLDDSRGIDAARALGSAQSDQNKQHTHSVTDPGHNHTNNATSNASLAAGAHSYASNAGGANTTITDSTYNASTGISIQNSGGVEARPRNVAMLACIKF